MTVRACVAGALVALCVAVTTATAAPVPVQVTEAAAQFPFRSYVVAVNGGRSVDVTSATVTENGTPVHDLSVTPASEAKHRPHSR